MEYVHHCLRFVRSLRARRLACCKDVGQDDRFRRLLWFHVGSIHKSFWRSAYIGFACRRDRLPLGTHIFGSFDPRPYYGSHWRCDHRKLIVRLVGHGDICGAHMFCRVCNYVVLEMALHRQEVVQEILRNAEEALRIYYGDVV